MVLMLAIRVRWRAAVRKVYARWSTAVRLLSMISYTTVYFQPHVGFVDAIKLFAVRCPWQRQQQLPFGPLELAKEVSRCPYQCVYPLYFGSTFGFVFSFRHMPTTECREYENAKYETYWSGGLNDKPVMQRIPRCTMTSIPFVVGGEVANPSEFPHMVRSFMFD